MRKIWLNEQAYIGNLQSELASLYKRTGHRITFEPNIKIDLVDQYGNPWVTATPPLSSEPTPTAPPKNQSWWDEFCDWFLERGKYRDEEKIRKRKEEERKQLFTSFFVGISLDNYFFSMNYTSSLFDTMHWAAQQDDITETLHNAPNVPSINMPNTMQKGNLQGTGKPNPNNVKVRQGQQNKHILGTNNYKQGIANGKNPSILKEDPQQLLDDFAGTGQKIGVNKERIDFGKIIGQYYDQSTGQYINTTNGMVHYDSNGGAHIVPARPNGY